MRFQFSAHRSILFLFVISFFPATNAFLGAEDTKVLDIGNRRELFVDDFLIGKLTGKARQQLHQPVPREIVLRHDDEWEGTGSGYHSIFQDGDLYRMYYKAWNLDLSNGSLDTSKHPLYCCYAESRDGIHWEKPELGICEFQGSKKNNIVLFPGQFKNINADPGHPAVFKDENPNCSPDAQYKAIIRSSSPHGLLAFGSADGIHWKPLADHPVITKGAFDSQNLAFWDPARKEYRAYWRIFTAGVTTGKDWKPAGVRAIRTATSKDFIHWGPFTDLTYVDSPDEQLYTNQIKSYPRAPHLMIGFPTRYVERGWNPSMSALPQLEDRKVRSSVVDRYGMAITEGLFMASRDGKHFKRWNEAFLPPGPERDGTWQYGHQYIGWHLVETKSNLEGNAPDEFSIYATERYWKGQGSCLRRYTLRKDGFVSIHAPREGGELITKPIQFDGKKLTFNFSSSAAGGIRTEIQTADGKPVEGFSAEESDVLFGDTLNRTVSWKGKTDLSSLSGKPIRLRLILEDADLYSLKFE